MCSVLVSGEEKVLGLCSPGDSIGCPVWMDGVGIYTGCPLDCLGYIKFTTGVEIWEIMKMLRFVIFME